MDQQADTAAARRQAARQQEAHDAILLERAARVLARRFPGIELTDAVAGFLEQLAGGLRKKSAQEQEPS